MPRTRRARASAWLKKLPRCVTRRRGCAVDIQHFEDMDPANGWLCDFAKTIASLSWANKRERIRDDDGVDHVLPVPTPCSQVEGSGWRGFAVILPPRQHAAGHVRLGRSTSCGKTSCGTHGVGKPVMGVNTTTPLCCVVLCCVRDGTMWVRHIHIHMYVVSTRQPAYGSAGFKHCAKCTIVRVGLHRVQSSLFGNRRKSTRNALCCTICVRRFEF